MKTGDFSGYVQRTSNRGEEAWRECVHWTSVYVSLSLIYLSCARLNQACHISFPEEDVLTYLFVTSRGVSTSTQGGPLSVNSYAKTITLPWNLARFLYDAYDFLTI